MLRDPSLVPLSRQHQHALALCVRIDRARTLSGSSLLAWQEEIQNHFEAEIQFHFSAEETVLFPVARGFPDLAPLVEELCADHAALRDYFARAVSRELDQDGLEQFVEKLSQHVRKEERQLFEGLQQRMSPAELEALGISLGRALASVASSCVLPRLATGPQPTKEQ
jgi:iron-sulfur cluster repair protein YtfE (RIC family)